jgi:hypothetical protein
VLVPLLITLTGLTPSFTLAGGPGSTVTQENAVQMTVITNSTGGYNVTVRGEDESLTGARSGNTDPLVLGRLHVKDSSQSSYTPLSAVDPILVRTRPVRPTPSGDAVSNDYEVDIPFVASDTYSTTLEYVVTAQ